MEQTRRIRVVDPAPHDIAPYGRLVAIPNQAPTRHGQGWRCWYGFDYLDCRWPLNLGVVATEYRPITVDAMERHTHTFELLYPHDHDLVQPLAQPEALDDPGARPDASKVTAIHIRPGEALIMHPGTWHSPAFPLARDCTYGFACMEPPDGGYVPEWVPFADDRTVTVARPAQGAER